MKYSNLNRTVDERTRQVIEAQEAHLNDTRDNELAWMKNVVVAYRNESNSEVKRILSEFVGRFEKEKSEASREFREQLSQVKQLIGQEKAKLAQRIEDLHNEIEKAQEELDSKDEEFESLQQSIRNADVNKDEVTFVFEVDNIAEFLKDSKSYERRFSEYFQCRGILWYLDISQSALSDGRKVLSGLLHSHNPDHHKWHIRVDFDLSLLNQSGKEDSPALSHENVTFRSEGDSFDDNLGWTNLIEIETLENGGFIKHNTIKLQVKLKALTKLIRGSSSDDD